MSYKLMSHPNFACRWIDDSPSVDESFDSGRWIDSPLEDELHYTLEKIKNNDDHSEIMPAYFLEEVPLFSKAFIAALAKAGVTNLQTFDALITDPENGVVYDNYQAVNILGLVEAADMQASSFTKHAGPPHYDIDFDRLVIDAQKARGFGMFRLAESSDAILVHTDVVEALRAQGFADLTTFYEADQCAL